MGAVTLAAAAAAAALGAGVLGAGAVALADPAAAPIVAAPIEAAIVVAPPAEVPAIAARLAGHAFRTGDGVVILDDVAGAGRPWTGVVERRADALWLVTALGAFELTGALARPRIAGPGYTVWALGLARDGRLEPTRLGILRRPARPDPPR